MGLHGKGIFGQSHANIGMPWLKCKNCGKRTYLRSYIGEKEWREKGLCPTCEMLIARQRLGL